MDDEQREYLSYEVFALTLMGTVQRANVYIAGSTESERGAFQIALRKRLAELARMYKTNVTTTTHVQNILGLASEMSAAHSVVLRGGRFRIGPAQKALNLYLKYLWCLGEVLEPPHCPFDRRVIQALPGFNTTNWTELDDIDEYRALVAAARQRASGEGVSIARWELRHWKRSQASWNPT